jgi:hypothetical protein
MADGQPLLRERHDAIAARMDDPAAAGERDVIKAEIIVLYKDTEREIAALRALREDIKKLVDRWKALTPAGGVERPAAPAPSAPPPTTPVMADRLGASTYVE